jgi:hypothetical protein
MSRAALAGNLIGSAKPFPGHEFDLKGRFPRNQT